MEESERKRITTPFASSPKTNHMRKRMRLVPTRSSIRRFRTEVDPRTLSNGIEFTLQSPRVDGNYFSGLVSSPEEKTTERLFIHCIMSLKFQKSLEHNT